MSDVQAASVESASVRKVAEPKPSKVDDRAERDRQKEVEKREKAETAGDKDLLSWTRVSMGLMTTGIGAERALAYLKDVQSGRRLDPYDVLHTLALSLVVLGLGMLIAACYQRLQLANCLRRGEPLPRHRYSLSLIMAVSVIVIFVIALLTVMHYRDVLQPVAHTPLPVTATASPAHDATLLAVAGSGDVNNPAGSTR